MKALVLAGGTGSRLRPLSYSIPKQLLPVANRPVLLHCLDRLREIGVTEVGVIVSRDRGAVIEHAVGDGGEFGMRVTYLPQDQPLGLAHCVILAEEFLAGDDFVMYLGDSILATPITGIATEFAARRPAARLLVTKVPDPSEYGVAEVDPDGRVTRVVEKPKTPVSDLALMGVYFFTPAIHEAARQITPSWRGELEITDAIQWLVSHGHDVRAAEYGGYWKDTGRVDDLLECNRVLLDRVLLDGAAASRQGEVDAASEITGPVAVAAGAKVIRSKIAGPAMIGADSVIVDSYVGPYTSIGSGCQLSGAGIEFSIVLDHVSVREVHSIHGSLIGRSAEIRLCQRDVPRHRLVVGDGAKVEVLA